MRNFVTILVFFFTLSLTFSCGNKKEKKDGGLVVTEIVTAPAPMPRASGVPAARATAPIGGTEFCLRLDGNEGAHLPALDGPNGIGVYPNAQGNGYNYILTPSADETAQYGVLLDGSIYVKERFLIPRMNSYVEIKFDGTNWAAVRMNAGTIGGEPAYVWTR